jgi:Flp pilus assembly protein TadD
MNVRRGKSPRRTCGALSLALALAIGIATTEGIADPSDAADTVALDADYAAGKVAIEAHNWPDAARRMQRAEVRFPDNADLQNYLGYAYRNLGQYDSAFRHYKQALALDPRHRGAHEYIGEAYLIVGDLASAERHLAALREICLLPCEEFDDLQKAVAAFRSKERPR